MSIDDAAGIARSAGRIFSTAPTFAALGNLKTLEDFAAIKARLI